jgi:hypothetical protein
MLTRNDRYKELRDFQLKPVCVYGQRYYRVPVRSRRKRVTLIFRILTAKLAKLRFTTFMQHGKT